MIQYVHVRNEPPFAVICDGDYDLSILRHRLDRAIPFASTKTLDYLKPGHEEITLSQFLKLHHL